MKKILLSLFGLLTLGLINFSSAGTFTYTGDILSDGDSGIVFSFPLPLINNNSVDYNFDISCDFYNYNGNIDISDDYGYLWYLNDYGGFDYDSVNISSNSELDFYSNNISVNRIYTSFSYKGYIYGGEVYNYICTLSGDNIINQSDLNNGNTSGTGENSWSALYINDIQHNSAGIIDITIPQEFSWDYTGDNEIFELNVNGYNVDTEYIEGIIEVQNYKPTSEDFTKLVLMLAPYSKYLLFILFVVIVWAWVKKSFKSKKL